MAKKAATKEVSMVKVHGSLDKAIAKLKKIKDPKAQQLMADLVTFRTVTTKCGQTMVFKFTA
jgi:hypothetical protein